MTGKQFLEIQDRMLAIQDAASETIEFARSSVVIPPIDQLRQATASDIVVGQIIYHRPGASNQFWHVIEEVRHPDDDFKAYVADDGCRYGIHEAWVDK